MISKLKIIFLILIGLYFNLMPVIGQYSSVLPIFNPADRSYLTSDIPFFYNNPDYLFNFRNSIIYQGSGIDKNENENYPAPNKRPIYLNNWFIALYIVIFILAGPSFYKWNINRLVRKQQALEKAVYERTSKLLNAKTTIEKQADELRSLDRIKSRFYTNISHELRTPLTLIIGPIKSLIGKETISAEDSKLLKLTLKNADQLLKLTNDILYLTKLESNKIEISESTINLYSTIETNISYLKSILDRKNIKLSLNYELDIGLNILIDLDKFNKILSNLLSNAIKFTDKNGEIRILVLKIENEIQLSVKDNGRGIHPENLKNIFDRFYQTKHDDQLEKIGSGIGLSICHEMATLLKGKIWAESILGSGSTFYFSFPANISEKPVEELYTNEYQNELSITDEELITNNSKTEPGSKAASITKNINAPTILLIEDNEDLREYISIILADDYHIITAENGQVGLETLHEIISEYEGSKIQKMPDLIISDLMMPVMDGFKFLEIVKENSRFRQIPVIMITAKVNIKTKLNALRIGVDDYLIKPFDELELKARIKNLLNNQAERLIWKKEQTLIIENKTEGKKPRQINEHEFEEIKDEWLSELETTIKKQIPDFTIGMVALSYEMNLSSRQLRRRIKQLTGLTPQQYIYEIRLEMAREILENKQCKSIKKLAHQVGLKDVKNFSSKYKIRYGKSPSEYL